jgi:hypothetical protein
MAAPLPRSTAPGHSSPCSLRAASLCIGLDCALPVRIYIESVTSGK